jgi:hypothetical protein
MITSIDNAQRTAAKIAGWSYLLSFAIVVFANYALLNPLIIPRNAVDTGHNIVAHQTQFRIALTLFLTYSIGAIVLAGALQRTETRRVHSGPDWCCLTPPFMIDNSRYLKHSSGL